MRWGPRFQEGEIEIRRAAMVYGLCYVVLLLVGLGSRLRRVEAKPRGAVGTVKVERGVELEEQGRYGVAARVYEREGQVEKAAQAAERAGEWERAARSYRRAGQDFQAAEMFYRAGLLPEAAAVVRAGPRLARRGRCACSSARSSAPWTFTKGGDRLGALKILEEAGRKPPSGAVPAGEPVRGGGRRLSRAGATSCARARSTRATSTTRARRLDVPEGGQPPARGPPPGSEGPHAAGAAAVPGRSQGRPAGGPHLPVLGKGKDRPSCWRRSPPTSWPRSRTRPRSRSWPA